MRGEQRTAWVVPPAVRHSSSLTDDLADFFAHPMIGVHSPIHLWPAQSRFSALATLRDYIRALAPSSLFRFRLRSWTALACAVGGPINSCTSIFDIVQTAAKWLIAAKLEDQLTLLSLSLCKQETNCYYRTRRPLHRIHATARLVAHLILKWASAKFGATTTNFTSSIEQLDDSSVTGDLDRDHIKVAQHYQISSIRTRICILLSFIGMSGR